MTKKKPAPAKRKKPRVVREADVSSKKTGLDADEQALLSAMEDDDAMVEGGDDVRD